MNSIKIGVGYAWGESPRSDRYSQIGKYLRKAAEEGKCRALRSLEDTFALEDDGDEAIAEPAVGALALLLPIVEVCRLRATVGEFTWAGITRRIDECDLLVFDLTPRAHADCVGDIALNVFLEIGYALGREKRIFLVHEDSEGFHEVPSDLRGLILGYLPDGEKVVDRSLWMAVVNAVRRRIVDVVSETKNTPHRR